MIKSDKFDSLFHSISNDIFNEGVINNCKWMYSPTTNESACGILSIGSVNGFDRWANSRIIEIHTILWDVHDPKFEPFVKEIISLFNK